MDAHMEVWLSDERWYTDPGVRALHKEAAKALEQEFQRFGYSVETTRGSGNTIVSVSSIPEGGWDNTLELALAELRRRDLLDRRFITVYLVKLGDPGDADSQRVRTQCLGGVSGAGGRRLARAGTRHRGAVGCLAATRILT